MRKFLFILIGFLCGFYASAGENSLLRAGNKAYQAEKYGEAYDLYKKAAQGNNGAKGLYNSAAALYKLKDYEAAKEIYDNLAGQNKDFSQESVFNAGNAAYMKGDSETAAANFKKAILLNNKDEAAIHNLQFVLQEKKDSRQNRQNKDGDNKDKDDKNENSDKQQNEGNQNRENQNNQKDSKRQQDKQQDKQQRQDQKLSKEEADNILQMIKDQSKNSAKPLPQAQDSSQEIKPEKDW
jgi:hypothetical protein